MLFRFEILELYLLAVSSLLVALAIAAWGRRPRSVARTTSFAMFSGALWTMGYAMILAATEVDGMVVWYKVTTLGMATVPTAWLLLAMAYSGRDRLLTARRVPFFLIEPAVVFGITLTNRWHRLWSTEVLIARVAQASLLRETGGLGYWFHVGYTYLAVPLGLFLLARELPRAGRIRRNQIVVLIVGASIPFLAEVVGTMIWNPFEPLDPTAFAFTATGLVFALVFFRRQGLDMIPVASGLAVESMGDGMLVLDRDERVTYINPAAERIAGTESAEAIGRSVAEVLPEIGNGEIYGASLLRRHVYQIRSTPLRRVHGRRRGRLLILSDVTDRKKAEEAAQRLNEQLDGLVHERTAALTETNRRLAIEVEERRSAEQLIRRLAHNLVSAQEEERRRISRDLHDEAGQLLNALKIWLSMLSEQMPDPSPEIDRQLAKIKSLSDSAIERIRKVVWELRPPTLDSAGLDTTLAWLCSQYEGQNGLTIDYRGARVVDCPETVSITLYRCLQEALNNISRHARATSARVRLAQSPGRVVLTVEDDGVGFIQADGDRSSTGLRGMRERVESVQGSLEIDTGPNRGTSLVVTVPSASPSEN